MLKQLMPIMAGLVLVAGGAAGALAHSSVPDSGAPAVHSDRAVWMTVQLPDGNVSTALTYDDTMATGNCGPPACPQMQGWGFLPDIQSDGSVAVKVYKLSFTKQRTSSVMGQNAQYVETINPQPTAETTKHSDANIVVRIVKTGAVDTLTREFTKMKSKNPAL